MAIKLAPVHPDEVLREEFLVPLGLTSYALAKSCGVPRTRIERLVSGYTNLTADTVLRLAKVFNTPPQFWFDLKNAYEAYMVEQEIWEELEKMRPIVIARPASKRPKL